MEKLTGIRDVDREILLRLDDYSLLKSCSLNNYFKNSVCDDQFLEKRLRETYPETIKFKPADKSWRQYFLEVIYYREKLQFHDNEHDEKVIPENVGDLKYLYSITKNNNPPIIEITNYILQKNYPDLVYLEKFLRKKYGTYFALPMIKDVEGIKYLMERVKYRKNYLYSVLMDSEDVEVQKLLKDYLAVLKKRN